jgi:hypothetical protein
MGEEKTAPCHVDEAVLSDPANEENDSLSYYFNATAHLLNVLYSDDKLRRSPLAEQVMALVRFWDAEPSERDNTKAYDAAIDAHLFGVVRKALWYLWKRDDPQLRKELQRLANDPEALVGRSTSSTSRGRSQRRASRSPSSPSRASRERRHRTCTPRKGTNKSGSRQTPSNRSG